MGEEPPLPNPCRSAVQPRRRHDPRLPDLLHALGRFHPGQARRDTAAGQARRRSPGFAPRDPRLTMTLPSPSGPSRADDGIRASLAEVRREIACRVCHGDIKRCRLAICPYLGRVREWFEGRRDLRTTNLFGASPPSAFVGSWGYPKVLVGPLVPPVRDEDTSILDASESWLSYDLPEILRFRLSLVRGKAPRRVAEARMPDRILSTVQEAAMASKPIDTEMWFTKKPTLVSPFSARAPPSGPSADLTKVDLASSPSVPRRVDDLVSDTDLRAGEAVTDLFDHGISQSQITRVFSVGLLGTKDRRRLVPTEWSITAVDGSPVPSCSWKSTTTGCRSGSGGTGNWRGRPWPRSPRDLRTSNRPSPKSAAAFDSRLRTGGERASSGPTCGASAGLRRTRETSDSVFIRGFISYL